MRPVYDKILDDVLPNALLMGIDYNLFWELSPSLLKPFSRAFELKQKTEDMVAWRSGYYVQLAIASAFNKHSKYPTSPLSSTEVKDTMTSEDIKNKMFNQMKKLNSRFGGE